ncbi:hypothetical protein GCM10009530_12140 [Microbispora corallina]|uniref:Lsr2 DNA-binding domain-containing protein n=1 Tax=Microbispora corallina TaxID=83302 RepID=A0ABQ4FTD6_9ACTN|nr:hypothetical protein Mco01_10890 [Microbispora corallina]
MSDSESPASWLIRRVPAPSIREWAEANGYGHLISARGRVSSTLLDAYYAAHPKEKDENEAPSKEHEQGSEG